MVTKRTCGLPLICLICGDKARGINFNVMSCMSCKTFFRRHATKLHVNLRCLHSNNCKINIQTRGDCSACRLDKCLTLGMNSKIIGTRFGKRKHSIRMLSQNDHSLLSDNEWKLLSNIIHAYDETNIISNTTDLLQRQSTIIPKIRSKPSVIFDIIKPFYSLIYLLIERTPYFHQSSVDTWKDLVRWNSKVFGTVNSFFIMRETHAMNYPAFQNGCLMIYDYKTMMDFSQFTLRLESNSVLVKIILYILAFSTNSSVVIYDPSEQINSSEINSLIFFRIQNLFINLLWKYLVHQDDTIAAVRWLNTFTKYILDLLLCINEQTTTVHFDIVNMLNKQMIHSLTVKQ